MDRPTYVLVHGAWHGAWCWRRLGETLEERGIRWVAPDLPSASGTDRALDMTSDVNALRRFTRDLGPVVLVAHSYAGAVVAEVAPRIAQLRAIVHLAALVPRLGQTASDVTREFGRRSALDDAISRDDQGFLHLDPGPAALALYGDCDDDTRRWAIAQTTAQTLSSFRTPRTSENIAVASTYVVCRRDDALAPSVQREVAQRCDDVVEIDSDHCPFLSHPRELADLIESLHIRG
jgi:pimeloyl-ACP methyl ester carboxylesterase